MFAKFVTIRTSRILQDVHLTKYALEWTRHEHSTGLFCPLGNPNLVTTLWFDQAVMFSRLNPYNAEIFWYELWRSFFFQFEIISNALVSFFDFN